MRYIRPIWLLNQAKRILRTHPSSPFQRVHFSLPGGVFTYHPVPKNACTTGRHMLTQALGTVDNYVFYPDLPDPDWPPRKRGDKPSIHDVLNGEKFRKRPADFRVCIVRDPVKRFLSMYSNRILFHRDHDVSFDDFVEDIAHFQEINGHFRSQVYFLGTDPDYYTHIFNIKQLAGLGELMTKVSGRPVKPVRLQTKGGETKPEMTPEHEERIRAVYREDYEVYGPWMETN